MTIYLDSSILVAVAVDSQPGHRESVELLIGDADLVVHGHALAEAFSSLTGGRLGARMETAEVTRFLRSTVLSRVRAHELSSSDRLKAFEEAKSRGVRGGAIYDYLHLVSAREAGADKLATLNIRDFVAFHHSSDPEIVHPSQLIQ